MNVKKIPYTLAVFHFLLFLGAFIYSISSGSSEYSMIWYFFYLIDFPISLLHFIGPGLYITKGIPILEWIFYPPYLIHGFLGAIWWYYLGRIFLNFLARKFL